MYKSPISLQKGNTVGLVAPAGKITAPDLQPAMEMLQAWGLNVVLGDNLFKACYQFAAMDKERLNDLQQMLDNPDIHAVLCARGGYGTTRIIDQIDFSRFLRNPKWIAGYSDITALHCHLHSRGVQSIHSIMPLTFGKENTAQSVNSLKSILFGEAVHYKTPTHPLNKKGNGNGYIIGGNLSLLVTVIGTPSDIDTRGKVLFIEDISEYLYHLDRMMIQMKRAGKLADLAGLVVGDFSDMKENQTPFGKTVHEIVAEAVQEYNYPVCYGFPVGHEPYNLAIPCGRIANLAVGENGTTLTFEEFV